MPKLSAEALDPVVARLVDEGSVDLHKSVSGTRKVVLAKAAAAILGQLVTSAAVTSSLVRLRRVRGIDFQWAGQGGPVRGPAEDHPDPAPWLRKSH